jgi:hypothetical protein
MRLRRVTAVLAASVALIAAAPAGTAAQPAAAVAPPAVGIEVGPPLPTAPPARPQQGQVTVGGRSAQGSFGVSGQVRGAIDDWFRSVVEDALGPALELVGRTLLWLPQITGESLVRRCWQVTLGIADGLVVLVIVIAGAVAIGHETVQTRYALKDVLPRLLLAVIAANASLASSGQLIGIANTLAAGLNGTDPATASGQLAHAVLQGVADGGIFHTLLGLVCAVLAVLLVVLGIARTAIVVLLLCAAPLMLLAHALPQTDGLAHLWWRAFTAALAVQVAQALILTVAVTVFFTPTGHGLLGLAQTGSLTELVIALCVLLLLVAVPLWARRFAFTHRPSRVTQLVKGVLILRAGALA